MIRVGSCFIVLLSISQANCQNDFFFNHYVFNPGYYNAGWVGIEEEAFLAGHIRTQWAGYSTSFDGIGGAPSTQLLSLVIPSMGILSGYGLNISNDRQANLNNFQIRFSVAYGKDLRFGRISFGIMPAVFSQSLDFGQLRPVEPEPGLPEGQESQTQPDLGCGIYFLSLKNYFIGVSVVNLLKPSFDYGIQLQAGESLVNSIEPDYLFNVGRQIALSRKTKFLSTALVRTDLSSYTFELSGILTFEDRMWSGLSYRRSESVIILLGYSLLKNNQLKLGYSFDYVVNDREAKQPTSHEIYLRYNLPGIILGGKKAVKTPRFPIK